MASALYSVEGTDRYVGSGQPEYFLRFDEAHDEALSFVQQHNSIAVIKRHLIDFGDVRTKVMVLMMVLNGKGHHFFPRTGEERLEAWGMTARGKLKRVNLRGLRWRNWDGTIR